MSPIIGSGAAAWDCGVGVFAMWSLTGSIVITQGLENCRCSGPAPAVLNQKLWGWGLPGCALTSPMDKWVHLMHQSSSTPAGAASANPAAKSSGPTPLNAATLQRLGWVGQLLLLSDPFSHSSSSSH